MDTGFTDHELSVQRKSGDVNIVAPYKEEMVGVANPGDLTAALESDSEVDTSEFATSVFEQQKNGLESIDLERRVSDLSSNYQTDVEPTLMDFAGVGAELIAFAYAPVGTALTLASLAPIVEAALSTGSEQDVDPGDGFSWPPDPGIPTSETGAVSQLFAAFDVMVPESSAGGELAIKTSFKIGHGDAVETSRKVTLDGGGEPDVGQCVDSRDVVRREMSIWADLDVDASATPHHATRPNAGIQQPTARRAYAVDGEIPFEPAQELWRNRWHVDKVGEGHCSPLQESELDGAVEKITSPGRWRVVHHARNQSGLSAIDEATIFVTEDESHEVLPLDSSNAVDPTELTLPQGADEYTEV